MKDVIIMEKKEMIEKLIKTKHYLKSYLKSCDERTLFDFGVDCGLWADHPKSKCSICGGTNLGSGPTGSSCHDCGWAYPGYPCKKCGRTDVNENHLDLRDFKKGVVKRCITHQKKYPKNWFKPLKFSEYMEEQHYFPYKRSVSWDRESHPAIEVKLSLKGNGLRRLWYFVSNPFTYIFMGRWRI